MDSIPSTIVNFYDTNFLQIYNDSWSSIDTLGIREKINDLLLAHKKDEAALHIALEPFTRYCQQNPEKAFPLSYHIKDLIVTLLVVLHVDDNYSRDLCFHLFQNLSYHIQYPEWHFFDHRSKNYKNLKNITY